MESILTETALRQSTALRMLGYSDLSDLIGKGIHEMIHHTRADGTTLPAEECRALATCRDGRPEHVDSELFWRKEGSSFPVEYRSHPIHHDGMLIGAVVTFADITRRRKMNRRCRQLTRTWPRSAPDWPSVLERTRELHMVNLELARTARAKTNSWPQ